MRYRLNRHSFEYVLRKTYPPEREMDEPRPFSLFCVYLYLLHRCDWGGVVDPRKVSPELAAAEFGFEADNSEDVFAALGDRVEKLPGGKWWMVRFMPMQFAWGLGPESKYLKPVIDQVMGHAEDLGSDRVMKLVFGVEHGFNGVPENDPVTAEERLIERAMLENKLSHDWLDDDEKGGSQ